MKLTKAHPFVSSFLKIIYLTILVSYNYQAAPVFLDTANNKTNNLIHILKSDDNISHLKSIKQILDKSSQVVVVVTKNWNDNSGKMSYFNHEKNLWKAVVRKIPVIIGKNGLGWGHGMIDFKGVSGPVKHEGDGKAPAGLFKLSYAFGYLPKDSVNWIKLDYLHTTESVECVDDTNSAKYNSLVDTNLIRKDWNSYEKMKLRNNEYKYGVFIEHNSNPALSGSGSCIFIHIWRGEGYYTTGCTALSEEDIIDLLKWLDPQKNPVLIQLPKEEFNKIKSVFDN